jgi:hypothetical protein
MFQEIFKNCKYEYAKVSSKKNIHVEVGSTAGPIKERPVFQK